MDFKTNRAAVYIFLVTLTFGTLFHGVTSKPKSKHLKKSEEYINNR